METSLVITNWQKLSKNKFDELVSKTTFIVQCQICRGILNRRLIGGFSRLIYEAWWTNLLRLGESLSGVHVECACTTTESIALRSILAAVAGLAVEGGFVTVLIRRVQHLVAHAAFKALLMELQFSNSPCLGSIHGLATSWALDGVRGFEWHGDGGADRLSKATL